MTPIFKSYKCFKEFLLLSVLCLLLYAQNAHAQLYNFKNFNVQDGMAQSQIRAICQDNEGNLWFGTMGGGISIYNGKELKTLTTKNGLLDNDVRVLMKDKHGDIWIGTKNGVSRYIIPKTGLATQNKSTDVLKTTNKGRFINYSVQNGINIRTLEALYEDKRGNIWIGGAYGLSMLPKVNADESKNPDYNLEDKKGLFRNFGLREELADTFVSSISGDDLGNVYIGTRKGINKIAFIRRKNISDENKKMVLYFDKVPFPPEVKSRFIRNSLRDNLGNMWFLTRSDIIKVDASASVKVSSDVVEAFDFPFHFFNRELIHGLIQDKKGFFWVASSSSGIYKFKMDDKSKSFHLLDHITTKNSLVMNEFHTLFEDREGNLWFGSDGAGAIKYSGKMFETFTPEQGLVNMYIFPIEEDHKGRIWFGSMDNGISVFLPDSVGKANSEFQNFFPGTNFPARYVFDLHFDKNNKLWIANDNGAMYVDPDSLIKGIPKYYNIKLGEESSLTNSIGNLFEDSKGNFWLASRRNGLHILPSNYVNYQNVTIINKFKLSKGKALPELGVQKALEDKYGNIWVAFQGGILSIERGIDLSPKPNFHFYDKSDGLIDEDILDIKFDNAENLWVASDDGVSKLILNPEEGYDPHRGKPVIKNYSSENGMSSDLVYLINMDNDGNMWFGTNKGLDQFLIDRGTFKTYGKAEGFIGIETNDKSTVKDKDGNLWFGTIHGVIKYNPSEQKVNAAEPITSITKLRVYFKDFEIPADKTFKYNQNYLTFDFVAVSLSVPEKVKYQWKLEGFDKDWLPESNETRVTYSNIPHGEYSFIVKACNDDGLWNKEPVVFSFTITPPFWKTWWFYTVCTVVSILSLIGFIKWRETKLKAEKMVLELKVAERTAELAEKNKKITQSINYAKRIQTAILPPEPFVKQFLKDMFILYKPRDIVSGDFYWYQFLEDPNEEKCLIAVVDCTGHGVPGALMSVVGYNLLNQAMGVEKENSPAVILENLNNGLSNTFKAESSRGKLRDGMDISLCAIDLKKMTVQYSGAHQPLFLVRDGEIEMKKADKFPIGHFMENVESIFTNQEFEIQKGDILYLSSDGYPDQFGGEENRKFMRQRFMDKLLEIHTEPMDLQRSMLDDTIHEWMGDYRQIDDILVIGIKIL